MQADLPRLPLLPRLRAPSRQAERQGALTVLDREVAATSLTPAAVGLLLSRRL